MKISEEMIEKFVTFVKGRYPEFEDFSHSPYRETERNYKEEASELAREVLAPEKLEKYIEREDSEAFIDAFVEVAQSTNLLFMSVPMSGDLSILFEDSIDNMELFPVIFELIHGSEPVADRLEKYLSFVGEKDASFKWTFPTYYLFLYYPDTEIFIKPSVTRWFLKYVDSDIQYSNDPDIELYLTFREYSEQMLSDLRELGAESMIDVQSVIYISSRIAQGDVGGLVSLQKREEFNKLFQEFLNDYVQSERGQDHINAYPGVKKSAENNFDYILNKKKRGEDITDDVLLKLLPYSESERNREEGAWIHIAPSINANIKKWFENIGWHEKEDWPHVSKIILEFVNNCIENPNNIEEYCFEFSNSQYSTGFQTGMITPILSSLKPEEFVLINNKTRVLYNYFAQTDYSQKLVDYPELNRIAFRVLLELENDLIDYDKLPELPRPFVLDIFAHWLYAVKDFDYSGLSELANPFSDMFGDKDQADFAFDWLAETAGMLGVKDPEDSRAAFTLRYHQGHHMISLSYCQWLVVRFSGRNGELSEVMLALFRDQYPFNVLSRKDFSQNEGEQPVSLYTFDGEVFQDMWNELRLIHQATLEFVKQRFSNWDSSPYHVHTKTDLAKAAFDLSFREDLFDEGIEDIEELEDEIIDATIHYWKIAPGADAWNWKSCRDHGYIAVGWDEMGDLSGMNKDQFEEKRDQLLTEHKEWTKPELEQVWKFSKIKENDVVVANKGTTKVLGIGKVTGDYYFVENERHGHRLPIDWVDTTERDVNEGGWRRTLVELSKDEFTYIIPTSISEQLGVYVDKVAGFLTEDAFNLLEEIHENPTNDYYMRNKDRFERDLFNPFQKFFNKAASRLPAMAKEELETDKRLFSQISKNDFGQGGAHDYYWGAFYLPNEKRTHSPQLSIWVNRDRLEFGFYIGDYGEDYKERFVENCERHFDQLTELLNDSLGFGRLIFGPRDTYQILPDGEIKRDNGMDWQGFLRDPEGANFDVTLAIPKSEVIHSAQEELLDQCLDVYQRVFPLILLAAYDEPMDKVFRYLEVDSTDLPVLHSEFSIAECAQKTYMDQEKIARWVRAIERKGQGVLYGPPGTGKTYLARFIAKHLIGGGYGMMDIIQFHPSYAYEDFMQGIRPKTVGEDKSLIYELEKGRFVNFCEEAKLRDGDSVLIIDEINRANLSRVFGELMYLLEYRDESIPLSAGTKFKIPENVYIIGTMNTADRSIALVDHALRRRFAFMELGPNYQILERFFEDKPFDPGGLIDVLEELNDHIGDKNYAVGITFFLIKKGKLSNEIADIWKMEIEPYLEEYFFDQKEKVENYRWKEIEHRILG